MTEVIELESRLKDARKAKGFSQRQVGEMIGIRDTAVSKLEKGENNPSERTIKLFCSALNVNETWLRTGEGDMFAELSSDAIDMLTEQHKLSPTERAFVETYLSLNPGLRQSLIDCMQAIVHVYDYTPAAIQKTIEDDIINRGGNLEDA